MIRGGGGGGMAGTRALSRTGLILETWNVGWTCMDLGSLSLTAADNLEGHNETRGQLLRLHPQGKVTGGEQNPLA